MSKITPKPGLFRGIGRRGFLIVLVPLIIETLAMAGLFVVLRNSDNQVEREYRSKLLALRISAMATTLNEAALRLVLPGNSRSVGAITNDINRHLDRMQALVKVESDFTEQEFVSRVTVLTKQVFGLIETSSLPSATEEEIRRLVANRLSSNSLGPGDTQRVRELTKELLNQLRSFEKYEEGVQTERSASARRSKQAVVYSIGIIVVLNAVAAAFVARLFGSSIVRRVRIMHDNTRRAAQGSELNYPISGDDELQELDSSFHEMTRELADARRKEEAIWLHAADIICSLTTDLRIARINNASERVFGQAPEVLQGKSVLDLLTESAQAEALAFFPSTTTSAGTIELELIAGDRTVMETVWSVVFSTFDNQFYCVVHDISARKRLERLKQEVLAMVSHDLRTPVASLLTSIYLLEEGVYGEQSPEGKKALASSSRSAQRLLQLINDLLDMEKLEAGQLEVELVQLNLNEAMERAFDAVAPLAEKGKISLELEEGNVEVMADMQRVVQVTINLLSNAIKYSAAGNLVRVIVDSENRRGRVRVIDQGRGIPADKIALVFERFKQVELSDSKLRGGTGLGLPICKSLIELQKGDIGCTSETGSGSTFWFTLPLSDSSK